MSFRDDFAWGTATASYQIEGGHGAGGRGPSIWDMVCRQPGLIFNDDTGDTACDHYHRWAEDVDLMSELGTNAYRLSLAWPRILPEGTGRINDEGLAFYDKLIDRLLERNITPWVTLFHWDYPLALYHRGGWLNRASVDWFREYAGVVADRLGDRVRHWITLNEPQCFIGLGHAVAIHAPMLKMTRAEVLRGRPPRADGPRRGRAGAARQVQADADDRLVAGRRRELPGERRPAPTSTRRRPGCSASTRRTTPGPGTTSGTPTR